ncbi:MAG: hexitol phosphatase HxpB [Flavobacteriales bacterium]|nr:hexitol phosphatase HxpB [Flavobacteriales bacterium]
MIEAAIFDMDGLLIDSEPFWRRAEMTVFNTVGINLSEANCRETMGFRLNEVVDLWYSRFPWTGKSKKQIEFEILDSVKELIQSEGEPLPGIYDTIELCKKLNLKTAVASSSAMVLIEATVDRLGIRNEFDTLQSAENEEFGKPHPSVFIKTAQRLGVRPENCIVFEDSFHGMVAGLAAKMKVIAVPEESSDRFLAAHSILNFLDSKRVKTFIENN